MSPATATPTRAPDAPRKHLPLFIREAAWMRASYTLAPGLFCRGMALTYLIAFASWWVQVDGLIGSRGIVPAAPYLAAVKDHCASTGQSPWLHFPTLFLWGAGDGWLSLTCLLGISASVLALLGLAQGPALCLAWLLYLSHATCGNVFMNFQWDALLLEAGLLAPLLASWRWWNGGLLARRPGKAWPVFLVQILLFKLMFLSGLVKLTSGDASWLQGKALTFHYETQPIPHAVAWYAHQLPGWFQMGSVWIMFVIELILPFLIFLGRIPRLVAFAGFSGLMLLIMATGNFTYFNLLTIILCFSLLDDHSLSRAIRVPLPALPLPPRPWLAFSLSLPLACLSLAAMIPGLLPLKAALAPFRCFNSYGLFRVMTTERPEIILESSLDGVTWAPYGFRWKPDDPGAAPRLVAPHQPRLDWQLWFAALGGRYARAAHTVWFENLILALLENRPEVTRLFHTTPWNGAQPRLVRARLYRYRFTHPEERRQTGDWWMREDLGLFFPEAGLRASP